MKYLKHPVKKGEFYINKKNQKEYRVADIYRHSESGEWMVAYVVLYPAEPGFGKWVRPMDLFCEKFDKVNR